MKKVLILILSLLAVSASYADDASVSVNISTPGKANNYYLCLYGLGCLNTTSGIRGKTFGVSEFDMGNITKVVITDSRTMRMYEQPNTSSCNVNVTGKQKLTITGQLQVKNGTPYINNLHCTING